MHVTPSFSDNILCFTSKQPTQQKSFIIFLINLLLWGIYPCEQVKTWRRKYQRLLVIIIHIWWIIIKEKITLFLNFCRFFGWCNLLLGTHPISEGSIFITSNRISKKVKGNLIEWALCCIVAVHEFYAYAMSEYFNLKCILLYRSKN